MTISEAERVWAAVMRAQARLVPLFDREMQRSTGLPLTWYDVLLELASAGGRLTMSDLGERVVLSRSRVSRIVDEMDRAGLVTREPNPDDGRSSYAAISSEGTQRFREAGRVYRRAIQRELGERADAADLAAVATVLEEVASAEPRRGRPQGSSG